MRFYMQLQVVQESYYLVMLYLFILLLIIDYIVVCILMFNRVLPMAFIY